MHAGDRESRQKLREPILPLLHEDVFVHEDHGFEPETRDHVARHARLALAHGRAEDRPPGGLETVHRRGHGAWLVVAQRSLERGVSDEWGRVGPFGPELDAFIDGPEPRHHDRVVGFPPHAKPFREPGSEVDGRDRQLFLSEGGEGARVGDLRAPGRQHNTHNTCRGKTCRG